MPKNQRNEEVNTEPAIREIDMDELDRQAVEFLAGAPEPLVEAKEEAVEEAAHELSTSENINPMDPEDHLYTLVQAFKAIGKPVPPELVDAALGRTKPTFHDGQQAEEEAARRQEVARRKANDVISGAFSGHGDKRANMLTALQNSPKITIYNRRDRYLMVNRVNINIPEGPVEVPTLVARIVQDIEESEMYANYFKEQARSIMNIEQKHHGSFKPAKVEQFSVF